MVGCRPSGNQHRALRRRSVGGRRAVVSSSLHIRRRVDLALYTLRVWFIIPRSSPLSPEQALRVNGQGNVLAKIKLL